MQRRECKFYPSNFVCQKMEKDREHKNWRLGKLSAYEKDDDVDSFLGSFGLLANLIKSFCL